MDKLQIADKLFNSRLFLGTGKFGSSLLMKDAILSSASELVTVALKRVDLKSNEDDLIKHIQLPNVHLLPAREALGTNWIKLEIHPDPKYLMPDPIETIKAAEELVKLGFVVLPYIHADPVLCKRLEEVGVQSVMPLGAPIGTNKGLASREFLKIIIEQSNVPVIVDAGIGCPSQAAEAMEMGADAVLVNTAIATANNPVEMAFAFKLAVEAGRRAFLAGLPNIQKNAAATSPLTAFLEN